MSVVLLILTVIAIVIVKSSNDASKAGSGEESTESAEDLGLKEQIFPCDVGDGVLVESLFRFTGMNPDCENQDGENIIAITVKNTSDKYLSSAEIEMTSNDGKQVHFTITNLPAGKTAMAFSRENESFESEIICSDITGEAFFDAEASMNDDKISVSVNGMHVILQSNIDEELEDIVVYCHSILDDQYFGGITYTYTVNKLPAYGTVELDAVDCITGLAEIVRIGINES